MSEFNQSQTLDNVTLERRAFRTAVILLAVTVSVILFYLYVNLQLGAWQMYVLSGAMAAYGVAVLVSIRLIRAGRIDTGAWIYIIGMYPLGPIATLFVTDISLIVSLVFIAMIFVTASQVLPNKQVRTATLISIGIAILNVVIDRLPLDYRLTLPVLRAFIPIAGGSVVLAALFFVVRRAWQGNLRTKLTVFFMLGAVMPLLLAGGLVSYQTYNSQLDQILLLESQVSERVAEQVENFILDRESELRVLTDVRGLGSLPRDEQEALLASLLSAHNIYNELILVDATGRERIYLSRLGVVKPEDLATRAGADEYEIPKASAQTYFGPVTFDQQTGEPRMVIAIPVTDLRTGEMSYALIANFRFKTVWDLMAQADVAGSGIVYMINDANQVIAHKNPSVVLQGTQVELPLQDSYIQGIDGTDVAMARTPITLNEQTFAIIAEQPRSEAIEAVRNSLIIIGVIIGLTILGSAIFGAFMARVIATPISTMAEAAQSVSAGDFSQRVEVSTQDEVSTLATAFNSMTAQLQEILEGLEQRVADRTKALATSAEVSRHLAAILDPRQLAHEVVNEVRTAFNYYYAQIYLLDEADENLVIAGGTGEAGAAMLARGHSVPKGRGLVGRAADVNVSVLIPDVSKEEGWLPNELLPETKTEAAVPISIGNQVLGVLDVQHNVVNGLTTDDVILLESLAAQVAITLRNARSYEQSRTQAELGALVNVIGQKIQRATSVEDTLQIAVRELGTAIGATRVKVNIKPVSGDKAVGSVLPPKPLVAKTEGGQQDSVPPAEPKNTVAE